MSQVFLLPWLAFWRSVGDILCTHHLRHFKCQLQYWIIKYHFNQLQTTVLHDMLLCDKQCFSLVQSKDRWSFYNHCFLNKYNEPFNETIFITLIKAYGVSTRHTGNVTFHLVWFHYWLFSNFKSCCLFPCYSVSTFKNERNNGYWLHCFIFSTLCSICVIRQVRHQEAERESECRQGSGEGASC